MREVFLQVVADIHRRRRNNGCRDERRGDQDDGRCKSVRTEPIPHAARLHVTDVAPDANPTDAHTDERYNAECSRNGDSCEIENAADNREGSYSERHIRRRATGRQTAGSAQRVAPPEANERVQRRKSEGRHNRKQDDTPEPIAPRAKLRVAVPLRQH